jgi:hypothetical protein
LREEEQRRREEAERIARPQTLMPYLEACHSLSLAIDIVTDRSLTTQGDPTNPVGRVYPQRIIPWDDFPARQEEIWEQLSEPSFSTCHVRWLRLFREQFERSTHREGRGAADFPKLATLAE